MQANQAEQHRTSHKDWNKPAMREAIERIAVQAWTPLESFGKKALAVLSSVPRMTRVRFDDQIEIAVDLPGVQASDISVWLDGSTLTVQAERNEHREKRTNGYYRLEQYRRTLKRGIALRHPVEADKMSATLKHGVLTIKMPKAMHGDGHAHRASVPVRSE